MAARDRAIPRIVSAPSANQFSIQLAELRAVEALLSMEERPSTTQFTQYSIDTIQETPDLEVVFPTVKSRVGPTPYDHLSNPNDTTLPIKSTPKSKSPIFDV